MADWRSLFIATPDHALEYFPPPSPNGSPLVAPPLEVFTERVNKWKHSILAQFLGQPSGFMFLQRTLSRLWEKYGIVKFNAIGSNLFIFQFENDEACKWILENGPWHVQNNPMILRKWTPNMESLELDFHKLPLWFHLHRVPLDPFHSTGLSYIASAIGVPLYMDSTTASSSRLSYAKVCVEISADIEPPKEIEVELEDGTVATVGVSIPWWPFVCASCKIFGHTEKNCVKKVPLQVWKEKVKPNADHVLDEKEKHNADPVLDEKPTMPSSVAVPDPGQCSSIHLSAEQPDSKAMPVVKDLVPFIKVTSKKKNTKATTSPPCSSSKGKHSITSSSNKFIALQGDEDEPEETRVYDDEAAQVWKNIIDNAKFTPIKTRAAAKGLDKTCDAQ